MPDLVAIPMLNLQLSCAEQTKLTFSLLSKFFKPVAATAIMLRLMENSKDII
jgi:hypothetical protein